MHDTTRFQLRFWQLFPAFVLWQQPGKLGLIDILQALADGGVPSSCHPVLCLYRIDPGIPPNHPKPAAKVALVDEGRKT
jgi:hypothetical protein